MIEPRWSTMPETPERSLGPEVADFASTYLVAPSGFEAGKPLRLTPWQTYALDRLYAVDARGRYLIRRALFGIARKNGKSILGAVMTLYELATNPLPIEVYSAAGSKEQASLILNEGKRILRVSPRLRDEAGIREYQYSLTGPAGAIYRVISADAKTAQGLNPTLAIYDEYHTATNAELYDALTLAQGARPNAQTVAITTAGFDLNSPLGALFSDGVKIARGESETPGFLMIWYAADDDAEVDDREQWGKANPNLVEGLIDPGDLALAARQTGRTSFLRYRLNVWTEPDEAWIDPALWNQNADPDLEVPADVPLYVAVRFGLAYDDAAVVAVWRTGSDDSGDLWAAYAWTFVRGADEVVDVGAVRARIAALNETSKVRVLAYDPKNAEPIAADATLSGIRTLSFPNTPVRLVPSTADLYRLIADERLTQPGDPTFTSQVLRAVPRVSGDGFVLKEPVGDLSITAARALVMATAEALHPVPVASIY